MTELQDIEEQIRRDLHTRYARRTGWIVVIIALIAAVLVLGIRDHYRGKAVEDLGSALNEQRQQVVDCAKLPKNTPECLTPVAPPADDIVDDIGGPVEVGPMGPPGPVGPGGPAPSAEQVQQAVNIYCSTGKCDGRGPTAQQVASAVTTYCNARGQCKGPEGTTGDKGDTGEQGPPPTSEQVQAAVVSYCSSQPDGNCVGPQGEPGQDGDNGRGIREVVCNQESREFVIVYTDDSRQAVEGSECKPEPEGPPITQGP